MRPPKPNMPRNKFPGPEHVLQAMEILRKAKVPQTTERIRIALEEIERDKRVERLRGGDWSFGHAGTHHGDGGPGCPRNHHHHCDEFCRLPSREELQAAGIDPAKFTVKSRR
jgi:hypothetical protein